MAVPSFGITVSTFAQKGISRASDCHYYTHYITLAFETRFIGVNSELYTERLPEESLPLDGRGAPIFHLRTRSQ
jgi:hypothetical protein